MTDNLKHIDLDDEQSEGTSKALRDYAKKLRAKLTEAEALASAYRKALAGRAVQDLLRQGNFTNPGRVERALLADEVDLLDANAVEAWFTANGDSYAKAPEQVEPEETAPEAEDVQFNPEQDQFERWLDATGQGLWSASTPTTERQDP